MLEVILRNISVKLFWIWPSGSGMMFQEISNLELLQPFC